MHNKRVILMQKMQIFGGRGHSPLPKPLPLWEGGHPLPHLTPSAPLAPRSEPLPFWNSAYATEVRNTNTHLKFKKKSGVQIIYSFIHLCIIIHSCSWNSSIFNNISAIFATRCYAVCVCVFVTFVHSVTTNKDIFEIFQPSGGQAILVFRTKQHMAIFRRETL